RFFKDFSGNETILLPSAIAFYKLLFRICPASCQKPLFAESYGRSGYYPAFMYGEDKGGSVYPEVNQNGLDYKWIDEEGKVNGSFTLLKDVSTHKTLSLNYGDTTQLRASWPVTYNWSSGQNSR
ncbi:MAG: hypothetical protein QM669_04345, partial [Siphonobacter sp.]